MTDACTPIVVQVVPAATPVVQLVQQNTAQQQVVVPSIVQSITGQTVVEQPTYNELEQFPSITDVVTQYLGPPGPPGATGATGPAGASGAGQVAPIAFSFGDAPHTIFTAPAAGVLSYVRVSIETPFNGVGASFELGTSIGDGSAMPSAYVDPHTVADYEHTPDLALTSGQHVYVTIIPGSGATAGNGVIFLQFLEN